MIPAEEVCLGGRKATVAGITRCVDRGLAGGRLCRVEVRLSSEPQVAVAVPEVKAALGRLLREHGLAQAEISVRQIEHPLDDALAEHSVRLLFSDAAVPPAAAKWRRWPLPWLAWFGRPVLSHRGPSTGTAARAAPRSGVLPLARKQAVDLLRQAVAGAARIDGAALAGRVVAQVDIVVRQPALHAALLPLIAPSRAGTAAWLNQMLGAHGVRTQPGVQVRYRHLPPSNGDATEAAGMADLEVRLLPASTSEPLPTAATLPTLRSVVHTDTARPDDATWMPSPRAVPPLPRVRVIGTLARELGDPFDLPLAGLPARFDRDALEAAGFGRAHASLLRIASRQQPLLIDRDAAGRIVVRVQPPAAGQRPMYYHRDTLLPLFGELALDVHGATLVVNDPAGGTDPTAGTAWSALVIRIDDDSRAAGR